MPLHELTPPHLRVSMRNKEEQKLFEKWAMSQGTYALSKEIDGSYLNGKTRSAFRAWVARSRIGSGWIKCSERMPTDGKVVIVCSRQGTVQGMNYFWAYGKWWPVSEDGDSAPEGEFSHWQPLPSPPEGA